MPQVFSPRLSNLGVALFALMTSASPVWAAAGPQHPNFSGNWAPHSETSPEGFPYTLDNVGWDVLSHGAPEKRKAPTGEQVMALARQWFKEDKDVFVEIAKMSFKPELTPAGQAAAKTIVQTVDPDGRRNPVDACYPRNVLGGLGNGITQIAQSGDLMLVYTEEGVARTIYLDGRNHDAAFPSHVGHSVGRFVRGDLVVETTKFSDDGGRLGFGAPMPMSDKARLVETFHITPDHKTLTIRSIYEDPEYLKEPIGEMVYLHPSKLQPTESNCLANIRGASYEDALRSRNPNDELTGGGPKSRTAN